MFPVDDTKYVVIIINDGIVVTEVFVEKKKRIMVMHKGTFNLFLGLMREVGDLRDNSVITLSTAFFGL